MPLTPATQKFFEQLKASKSSKKPLWEMTVDEFLSERYHIEEAFRKLAGTADSSVKKEIIYIKRPDNTDIEVQVLTPSTAQRQNPAIIYFPGNGFSLNLNMHWIPCSIIAQKTGYKIFIVNCALAPEHKYPKGSQDAFYATNYFYNHAEEFSIDTDCFAIGGDSSGGNFAALTAIKLRDYSPNVKISFQLLISPNVDETLTTYSTTPFKKFQDQDIMVLPQAVKFFKDLYLPASANPSDPQVSPLFANLTGLPPTILSFGEYDGVRGDAEAYYEKLKAQGNKVTKVIWLGQTHNAMICRGVFNDDTDPAETIAEAINKQRKYNEVFQSKLSTTRSRM